MTWRTFAYDGETIGSLGFLENYWHRDGRSLFERKDAAIVKIAPEHFNQEWDVYRIRGEVGSQDIHLRRTLRPAVCARFGVESIDALVGMTIFAYYHDKALEGITPKQTS